MTEQEKQKSIEALRSAAIKAIKLGYLDLASQIMYVAETLERSNDGKLVELPPMVLTMKRNIAN